MSTLPGDFVRLQGPAGYMDLNCHEYGIVWPPPERITHIGGTELEQVMVLQHHSDLTDEQSLTTQTARGAIYLPVQRIEDSDE